ncbi:MAG: histidine phosphatase family protein [Paracoccaceae bacterium]|nr:histidine phosphatase family protein [Paracoccaceae bacterium]
MAFAHPFYFLRHGETHWNRAKRTQGQTDAKLNETGRAQAASAAEALRDEPIERIVSSPLSRAHDTAMAVAAALDLGVETDDGLMECHLGDRQGEPHGDWLQAYFRGEYAPPNGETFDEFCTRTWVAMRRAVALGPNSLIVAHGGLWISARRYVTVDPDLPRMPNALPLKVTPKGDVWRHQVIGDRAWTDSMTV